MPQYQVVFLIDATDDTDAPNQVAAWTVSPGATLLSIRHALPGVPVMGDPTTVGSDGVVGTVPPPVTDEFTA